MEGRARILRARCQPEIQEMRRPGRYWRKQMRGWRYPPVVTRKQREEVRETLPQVVNEVWCTVVNVIVTCADRLQQLPTAIFLLNTPPSCTSVIRRCPGENGNALVERPPSVNYEMIAWCRVLNTHLDETLTLSSPDGLLLLPPL